MAKIVKLKNIESGEYILPQTILDAVMSNDGSVPLTVILDRLSSKMEELTRTVEDGLFVIDGNGYVLFSVTTNGMDCTVISDNIINIVSEKIKDRIQELIENEYSDGENIPDMELTDKIDDLYVEVYDEMANLNRKINLKDYVLNLINTNNV
jgi:hypothetical protein